MLRYVRLPSVDNVGNSQRFTVKLPIGPTYVRADLKLGGTFTAAMISNLEFAINGRPVQRFASGSDLDKLNQRLGRPASSTNNILSFFFRRTELEEVEEAEMFDIGTARPDPNNPADALSPVVETLTITGDISGATSPTIEAWAETSSKIRPLRMLTKILYFPKTFSVSTTGAEGDFDAFPIGYPNATLMGIHLKETVDNTITKLRVTANIAGAAVELLENAAVSQLENRDSASTRKKTAQANFVHFDLVDSGQVQTDGLPLGPVGDLRARLTCLHASNTTEQVVVYTDMVDTFQGA